MFSRRLGYLLALGLVVPLTFVALVGDSSTAGGPGPMNNGDVNGDQGIDIGDAVYLLSFLFSNGPPPVAIAGGVSCECDQGMFRISSPPGSTLGPRLIFGPTDDCSLGIIPGLPGLTESDPFGFRLLGPGGQGCRLLFGPTDLCTVEVAPGGPSGLLLRDPAGIRLLDPMGNRPRLRFGPTDDCSLGIDPALPGLTESDPFGFRLLGPGGQGCRLLFGPTDLCTVEVDPLGPSGLLLRDPAGIRLLDPAGNRPRLRFGPTDDCSLGIDPVFPGLIENDPVGFRLLGQNNQGCRLIFGPTLDCTVEVNPTGPSGLLLRDPASIRVLGSSATGGPGQSLLRFGPTDDCSISVNPPGAPPGMRLRDPAGFFFEGGPVFATQFIPISTERFKENIRPIDGALEKLQALEGVQFEWKDQLSGRTDIGFVAEEVLKVVPEVVACDDDGTPRGLCYDHLVALAVEGIKDQQDLITGLESEKNALQDEVATLKSRLARLEALVETLTAAPK